MGVVAEMKERAQDIADSRLAEVMELAEKLRVATKGIEKTLGKLDRFTALKRHLVVPSTENEKLYCHHLHYYIHHKLIARKINKDRDVWLGFYSHRQRDYDYHYHKDLADYHRDAMRLIEQGHANVAKGMLPPRQYNRKEVAEWSSNPQTELDKTIRELENKEKKHSTTLQQNF